MEYIAVLEYEHMDNSMFLGAFSRALSRQQTRGIILHGDSEYTERLIQTGVMRQEATIRAIKDLNHRLVALFADQGISTIGINGYQKSLVTLENKTLSIDVEQLHTFPTQPVLLISGLALNTTGDIAPVSLPDLALVLKTSLRIEKEITTFSIHESSELISEDFPVTVNTADLDDKFKAKHLPESFRNVAFPLHLTTTQKFL